MSIEYGKGDTKFTCDGDGCGEVAFIPEGAGMPKGWKCGGEIEALGDERHYCPRCAVGRKTCEVCN